MLHVQQRLADLRARCAPTSVATGAGLVLAAGGGDAWDGGAVSNPVVRVFPGKEGSRWFMWYTGRQEPDGLIDPVFPAAGSVGALLELPHNAGQCMRLARADCSIKPVCPRSPD